MPDVVLPGEGLLGVVFSGDVLPRVLEYVGYYTKKELLAGASPMPASTSVHLR